MLKTIVHWLSKPEIIWNCNIVLVKSWLRNSTYCHNYREIPWKSSWNSYLFASVCCWKSHDQGAAVGRRRPAASRSHGAFPGPWSSLGHCLARVLCGAPPIGSSSAEILVNGCRLVGPASLWFYEFAGFGGFWLVKTSLMEEYSISDQNIDVFWRLFGDLPCKTGDVNQD